ncbi:MAG: hypothetical protein ABW123_19870 [Cystobacter sp.]
MNGRFRIWLAVLGALLLPLPLLGLFAATMMKTFQDTSRGREPVVIPMLQRVEREGVLTYGTKCKEDSDCDPRLRCVYSMVLQYRYCTDSHCVEDKHCPEDFTCQPYALDDGRSLINACSRVGIRKEGEECDVLTVESDSGCERGLVCQDWCGRPCTPEEPTACPEGFFCRESLEGSACQPTCRGRACPDGQRCIDVGGMRSVCAKIHGTDCQAAACGPGQDCSARTYPWAPGEVWMQCSQTCGFAGKPPCPEGTACAVHRCRPTCSMDGGTSCEEGFKCTSHPNQPAVCAPDVIDQAPP